MTRLAADPMDDISVDRNGFCRWAEVTKAFRQYQQRIENMEVDMEYISRMRIMDSLTAINMRAVARNSMKASWYGTQ